MEWINDALHDSVVANAAAKWHSDRDALNFTTVRRHFDQFEVQLGYSKDADLLIGDTPVITTRHQQHGVGPHQGIAVKMSDHIGMPIAPHIVAALGPTLQIVEIDDEITNVYNKFQCAGFVNWIAARPDGRADLQLKLLEAQSDL